MPKRDISSFFNSLPKRQKTDSDDHVGLEAAKLGPKASSKSHQKRLTPSKVSVSTNICRDGPHRLA